MITDQKILDYPIGKYLEDLPALAKRSLVNCHAQGLDSIMFDDTPQARVRMFITNPRHELWLNDASLSTGFRDDMSLALHPHHCTVWLIPVVGEMYNITARPISLGKNGYALQEFRYQSPITSGGPGSFAATGKTLALEIQSRRLTVDDYVLMSPKDIHTVFVPRYAVSAWLVIEGYEDDTYDNVCYSKSDLTKFSFDGMYAPMSVSVLKTHLRRLGVEVPE